VTGHGHPSRTFFRILNEAVKLLSPSCVLLCMSKDALKPDPTSLPDDTVVLKLIIL